MPKRVRKKSRYLCRKLEEGEIVKEDVLATQAKITLLSQAPAIVSDAVAKGWISYPINVGELSEDDPSHWVHQYDCERAYQMREEGMTHRSIAKFLCCAIGRVNAILNRGRELSIHRKQAEMRAMKPQLPTKQTIQKLLKQSKPKQKA